MDLDNQSDCKIHPGQSVGGANGGVVPPNVKDDLGPMARPRASTISPGATIHKSALPTVFRWEGGGGKVYVRWV
jgi:hypothetical protein